MGAPHADLSRHQEARGRNHRGLFGAGAAPRRLGVRDDPKFPDCTPDTVNGFNYLHQAYTAADPKYTGKVTVPTLWDKKTKTIVNNESSEIIRMLNSEFNSVGGDNADYYPKELRAEIDRINEQTYFNVNNGVYRAGFAKSQDAYEAAYDGLFATLDELEARLSQQRYLVGKQITEADWRLFPTLLRFDVAYFSIFKCNRQRIADYPNLKNYMLELYNVPGIAATVKPRYYVIDYYSIERVNPTGIIPKARRSIFRAARPRPAALMNGAQRCLNSITTSIRSAPRRCGSRSRRRVRTPKSTCSRCRAIRTTRLT